jgi:UDP-N-acetylmuramyl tripeptide synthase
MVQGLPIEKGMKKLCRVISDRHEAIKVAVQLAEKGDTVVLAGKGHEAYQEFKNGERVFFDDRAEAMGALAEKKLTAAGAKL